MGKKLTKNEKISTKMTGRKLSSEHKRNISVSKTGYTHSDYTREKIKNTLLGITATEVHIIHPIVPKTSKSRSHLTAEDVKAIRDRYTNEIGTSIRMLAEEYNVSRNTIHGIVTYKIWK